MCVCVSYKTIYQKDGKSLDWALTHWRCYPKLQNLSGDFL